MEGLRRSALAASLVAAIVLGCSPKVTSVTGASPGIASSSYLTADTPSMVIEVIPTANHSPSPEAMDLLMARARERCNKPGGIELQVDEPVAQPARAGAHHWSYQELIGFEQAHGKLRSTPEKAVLTVLYLDGFYAPNMAAIAISYTGDSIAIFTDMLGPRGPEGPALVHELGHQLGLVNGSTRQQTPHEDGMHALHDVNPSCVMFYSLDPRGDAATANDYCAKCKADLKAAGGK